MRVCYLCEFLKISAKRNINLKLVVKFNKGSNKLDCRCILKSEISFRGKSHCFWYQTKRLDKMLDSIGNQYNFSTHLSQLPCLRCALADVNRKDKWQKCIAERKVSFNLAPC